MNRLDQFNLWFCVAWLASGLDKLPVLIIGIGYAVIYGALVIVEWLMKHTGKEEKNHEP